MLQRWPVLQQGGQPFLCDFNRSLAPVDLLRQSVGRFIRKQPVHLSGDAVFASFPNVLRGWRLGSESGKAAHFTRAASVGCSFERAATWCRVIEMALYVRKDRYVLDGGSHLNTPTKCGGYVECEPGSLGLGDGFGHGRIPYR
jgi:hypothetical protein